MFIILYSNIHFFRLLRKISNYNYIIFFHFSKKDIEIYFYFFITILKFYPFYYLNFSINDNNKKLFRKYYGLILNNAN